MLTRLNPARESSSRLGWQFKSNASFVVSASMHWFLDSDSFADLVSLSEGSSCDDTCLEVLSTSASSLGPHVF